MTTSEFITAEQQWERVLNGGQSFAKEIAELHAKAQHTDCPQEEEELEEEARQQPLSVEVRSCWRSMGQPWEAGEYRILLSTGGPAMQVTGKLDMYDQPADAVVQVQDWFKPWTDITHNDTRGGCSPSVVRFAVLLRGRRVTITALIIGAANVLAILWVLWACKRRRPTTPQEFRRYWQNHRREPLVRDRPGLHQTKNCRKQSQ